MSIPLSLFLFFVVYFLIFVISDIFHYYYFSKKCKYNCSSCKYWPCPAHRCNKKRLESSSERSDYDE